MTYWQTVFAVMVGTGLYRMGYLLFSLIVDICREKKK